MRAWHSKVTPISGINGSMSGAIVIHSDSDNAASSASDSEEQEEEQDAKSIRRAATA